MEVQLRSIVNHDWLLLVLLTALVLLALSVGTSRTTLLQQWNMMRVATYDPSKKQKASLSKVLYTSALLITASLLVFLWYSSSPEVALKDYIVFLTLFSCFFLAKHYIARIYFNFLQYEDKIERLWFYTSRPEQFYAYIFLVILLVWHATFEQQTSYLLWIMATILVVQVASYIIALYRCRKTIMSMWVAFILYLCALEILPYVVLYKQFIE